MSYTEIDSADIETGDPVTNDLWALVKANFTDLNTRVSAVEAAVQTFTPLEFKVKGAASLYAPVTGQEFKRIFHDITLTGARLLVPIAGSAGTWDFDIQYKRGGGAFASIFSTRPSVAFGAGDYAVSSNAVFSVTSLLVGDILRFDVQGGQTDSEEANLYLEWEKT